MRPVRSSANDQAHQVLEVQSAWVRAQSLRDFKTMDVIAADEFTAVRPDGSMVQRDHALQSYVRTASQNEQIAVEGLDVRLYGNVAVVIGRLLAYPHGKRAPQAMRFMDVLVMRDKRWQMVAEEITPIA